MARKKRKTGKSPPVFHSAPSAETGGRFAWALPVSGWLALVLAWLAALGGFSDGTAHIHTFINNDSVQLHILFRELFVWGAPLDALVQGPTPYYFPEMAVQWAMFALGAGAALALALFPLAQAALSAAGWVLLCDRLFGKSPVRRAAVPMLHSIPFLFLAWDNADIFHSQMMGATHHGIAMFTPWVLWLSLLVLDSAPERKQSAALPAKPSAALAVLLAVAAGSDLLVVPQIAVPMGFCAALLSAKGALSARKCALFLALMCAGIFAGRALKDSLGVDCGFSAACDGVSPDWGEYPRNVARLLTHFGNAAARNPLAAAAWLAFAAIGSRRALAVLRPALRRTLSAPIAVPPGFGHSLSALFVPAAVASSFLAAATAGTSDASDYTHPDALPYEGVTYALRYALPVIYLPLFACWALLPGGALKFGGRAGGWALAACAALAVLSAPKAARIDFAALDPFATPFQKCLAENAARLDLRGGITTIALARLPLVHSGAEIERLLPVGVFRRPEPGQSFMVADYSFSRRAVSGEFDFVLVNRHNGRYFYAPPLAGETGCAADDPARCSFLVDSHAMDAATARAAFGEPKEEINCAGIGLLHYDPPLKFDFSARDNPYLAPVARW